MPQKNPSCDELLGQVSRFPESPGVYIMKDARDEPIYIGKAVNLRSRVRSYFSDTHEDRAQIPIMLQQLAAIEWIATNTEAEALILEANLIRKHTPRYNIDLRDDKHFPYIKITTKETFPRLLIVRRVEKDGSRYFGPYTDAGAMRRLAGFARRIFRIRDCTLQLPLGRPRQRPCINHSMGRCSGACAGKTSPEEYRGRIDDLLSFLSGKRNRLLAGLRQRMEQASAGLRFEEAAALRDQMRLIRDAGALQQVDLKVPDADCDAFGLAENGRHLCLSVLAFREGLLMSSRSFVFGRAPWDLSEENRNDVIPRFYLQENREIPPEILLPVNGAFSPAALQQWFDDQNVTTAIQSPKRGLKMQLVAMAEKNARLHLLQTAPPSGEDDCAALQTALRLKRPPLIIEAFDISNLGGSFCVAAMVRFKNGMPDKSGYRRYRIKTVSGQNDFAMMMEAVSRRFGRLQKENGVFPDLLLIDGGKGQLHAAMEALKPYKDAPAIAALAKKEELLFSPRLADPVRLSSSHPARRLVERIRDEAHRFAVSYHRKLRGRQFSRSGLEALPGVGPRKSNMLLKAFGSVQRIKKARVEDIANVKGFSLEQAIGLKNALDGI